MFKKGFTLSEVLITLGVVGVVAAMTIPSLVNKYREKVTVTKLEKFYSSMSQQFQLNLAKEIDNPYSKENLLSSFKVKKICPPSDLSCAPEEYYYYNGNRLYVWGKYDNDRNIYDYAVLQDGIILRFREFENCNGIFGTTKELQSVCDSIYVDINGNLKPNTLGKDVFAFYITKNTIIPTGTPENTSLYDQFKDCKKWGYGCTYYVLQHKTLNYDKYKL